jgi:hypothetical protein
METYVFLASFNNYAEDLAINPINEIGILTNFWTNAGLYVTQSG